MIKGDAVLGCKFLGLETFRGRLACFAICAMALLSFSSYIVMNLAPHRLDEISLSASRIIRLPTSSSSELRFGAFIG